VTRNGKQAIKLSEGAYFEGPDTYYVLDPIKQWLKSSYYGYDASNISLEPSVEISLFLFTDSSFNL